MSNTEKSKGGFDTKGFVKQLPLIPLAIATRTADNLVTAPVNIARKYREKRNYKDLEIPAMDGMNEVVVPATYERSSLLFPDLRGTRASSDEWIGRTKPYTRVREGFWDNEFMTKEFEAKMQAQEKMIREGPPWETGRDMAGVSLSDPYKPQPKINTERWNRPFPAINTERWNNPPEPRTTVARSPRYGKDPKLGLINRLQPNKQRSLDNL